jgi:purine nucleosidase
MPRPIDVVIDTDIGADPDDAIALALAVASPELNVRGVTIVSGDVGWRAEIASRVLGMLGRAEIPVICGSGDMGMLGIEGRGLLDRPYDGPASAIVPGDATSWLIDESRRAPYHLIAIGPLTNLASAIGHDAGFVTRLSGISAMGGVYNPDALPPAIRQDIAQRGIAQAWPDYNTMTDAPAALTVAESGAPINWTTTEITFTVPLSRNALDLLPPDDPFTGALRGMIGSWDTYREESGTSIHGETTLPEYTETFLHDPLTVGSLFHTGWLAMTPVALRYAIDETVFRLYPANSATSPNATVSTGVDGAAFAMLCMRRIANHLNRDVSLRQGRP